VPRRQVVLIAVGVTAVSFGGVLVRLADAPAFAVAFYRVFFAAAILTTIGLLRHRDEYRGLTAQQWRLAALSGAALAVHFATWISSLSYTTVAASVVLVETQPIWVGLFGRFVGERPTRRGKLGIAVALLGTLVISGGAFDTGPRALWGDLLAVAGAIAAAVYVLLGRNLRQSMSLVTYTSVVYSVSSAVLAAVMLVTGTPFFGYPPETWVLFALMTAGPQLLGHTVFNYLLGSVRATVVAVALVLEPVMATILALVILGERPGVVTVLGGAVVLVGVYLAIVAETDANLVAPVE
jgi:drug/metabolite transporter (DMT)-like permease